MSATRVRVLVEFRNGNGNYLHIYHAMGKESGFVPCSNEYDVEAIENAFIEFMRSDKKRVAKMLALKGKNHQTPGRD